MGKQYRLEELLRLSKDNAIILYDGDCLLCSRFVQWVIHSDSKGYFKFLSFQHIVGDPYKKNDDYDSVVLLTDEKSFEKSDVTIEVARMLKGRWLIFYCLRLLPKILRNRIYDVIASNRYNWFGMSENCLIITPKIKSRLL